MKPTPGQLALVSQVIEHQLGATPVVPKDANAGGGKKSPKDHGLEFSDVVAVFCAIFFDVGLSVTSYEHWVSRPQLFKWRKAGLLEFELVNGKALVRMSQLLPLLRKGRNVRKPSEVAVSLARHSKKAYSKNS